MSINELTDQIMGLSASERAVLAQRLWESVEDEFIPVLPGSEDQATTDAKRRDAEISQGDVPERSHENVMKIARRSLECE